MATTTTTDPTILHGLLRRTPALRGGGILFEALHEDLVVGQRNSGSFDFYGAIYYRFGGRDWNVYGYYSRRDLLEAGQRKLVAGNGFDNARGHLDVLVAVALSGTTRRQTFNQEYPIGTPVLYHRVKGKPVATFTTGASWDLVLGEPTVVVELAPAPGLPEPGKSGGYNIDSISRDPSPARPGLPATAQGLLHCTTIAPHRYRFDILLNGQVIATRTSTGVGSYQAALLARFEGEEWQKLGFYDSETALRRSQGFDFEAGLELLIATPATPAEFELAGVVGLAFAEPTTLDQRLLSFVHQVVALGLGERLRSQLADCVVCRALGSRVGTASLKAFLNLGGDPLVGLWNTHDYAGSRAAAETAATLNWGDGTENFQDGQ